MKQLLFISLLLLLFSCSRVNVNKEIVAEVNGESILLSDLSEASKQELFDLLNMAYEIKGSDIYYMEANHDLEALKRGPYPYPLKLRVMSNMGHLSNDQSAEVLADALEGKEEKVFLGHLSETNNTPELSRLTVDNYLTSLGLDTKKDILLEVADRYAPSGIVEL